MTQKQSRDFVIIEDKIPPRNYRIVSFRNFEEHREWVDRNCTSTMINSLTSTIFLQYEDDLVAFVLRFG